MADCPSIHLVPHPLGWARTRHFVQSHTILSSPLASKSHSIHFLGLHNVTHDGDLSCRGGRSRRVGKIRLLFWSLYRAGGGILQRCSPIWESRSRRGTGRSGQGVESLEMGISPWNGDSMREIDDMNPTQARRDLDAYPSPAIGDVIWIGTRARGLVFGNLGL